MSALRLANPGREQTNAAPAAAPDPVSAYLAALSVVLRLPARQRDEIRDELEAHLRERVRDLMLGGADEQSAARQAVAELGEVASIAERFRQVRSNNRRRLAMNTALFGLIGGSLVLSVVSLVHSGGGPVRGGGDAGQLAAAPQSEPVNQLDPIEVSFQETPLSEVFDRLAEALGTPVYIHWNKLEQQGLMRDTPVTLKTPKVPHRVLHRLLNESLGREGADTIAAQLQDGVTEIATQAYFDRLDTTLEAMDLSAVLPPGDPERAEQIVDLIRGTVEPTIWLANGGECYINAVGKRLFVKAPRRVLPRIQWVLDQLRESALRDPAPVNAATFQPLPLNSTIPVVGKGGDEGLFESRTFELSNVSAHAARDLLGEVIKMSPELRDSPVPRILEVNPSGTRLTFHAPVEQVRTVERLMAIIDGLGASAER